ncbi:MAG TPA: NAD+ synthase [Actinomycetota bacterium]|nr:NAD+ synthase [Actinomycetota bacterium]
MRTLRVALAQVNATVGDVDGNARVVREWIERARDAQADLVAFPEMVVTGYPAEDLLLKPSFIRANLQALAKIATDARGICAVVGFADLDTDLRNAAAVCADGGIAGVYHKHFLPNYGVFDEDRYFRPGTSAPVFVINGVRVGVSVCEDIWYSSGPAEWQSWAGAEVLVNINGSPYHAGKLSGRKTMLSTRASDHVAALAYVNLVGGQDELVFDGGSMVFDADGALIASAPQFVEDFLIVDIDVEAIGRERLHDPRMRKIAAAPDGVATPTIVVSDEQASHREPVQARITQPLHPDAEIYDALVLGVGDYVRKNGFREVLVGISGGIDSSLVAAIAADAAGPDAVTGIVLSSRYSSQHSREDAFELARRLGIRVLDMPIDGPHLAVEEVLREHIEREPGRQLAEENVQARIRGLLWMALSNARPRSLMLTAGNKSELATGYATLYGDMAGGFCVLKDVPKTLVYRLARHRNSRGEVIPLRVLDKAPSAELRPDQKDTDSLPPYDVLDPILQAYVEDDRSVDEIVGLGFDRELVRRIVWMVDANEYKRRQAPPGVKVTERAFGRDRRLPITNRWTGD